MQLDRFGQSVETQAILIRRNDIEQTAFKRFDLHLIDAALEYRLLYALANALARLGDRSEEHTSELQSLMRISYAVFCLKKKKSPIVPSSRTEYSTTNSSPQPP